MNRAYLISLALMLVVETTLSAQDNGFIAGKQGQRLGILQASTGCFVCGRTPQDYASLVDLLMGAQEQSVATAASASSAKQRELMAQGQRIDAAISEENRAALQFPLRTARKDIETFSKMIPDLAVLLAYANAEKLADDTRLGDVLRRMKDGASSDSQTTDVTQTLRTSVQLMASLKQDIASAAFVRVQYSASNILEINAAAKNLSTRNDYQKWKRAHQSAIDEIRNSYQKDPESARTQYETLISQTKSVTPVLLQQALRTGILSELTGQPRAAVMIILCPVCRKVFETLDEDFANHYEKPE